MRGAAHIGPVGLNIKEVASLPLDGDLDDLCIYDGSWYRHDGVDWVQISGAASGLADPGGNGVVVRTALDTTVARTITGGTSISVADGDGVAGNPTITRAALTGDVTAPSDSNATTIANDTVTNAKLANVATATIKGRTTAGTGDPEDLTASQAKAVLAITSSDISDFTEAAQDAVGAMVDSSLTYVDGTPLLQRAALTGDVTAAAGGNATTIANDTVTYAKMQNVSVASKLLGRGSAGGAGDVEEITLGSNLSMSGTTLNATGGGGLSDGDYGDITVGGGGTTLTIDNSAVTLAKMANLTGYRIIGRDDAVAGTPTALSVSGGLEFLGTGTGIQRSALTGDVTASAGSNATTIANDAVTFGKMQNIATDKLLGRDSAASGDVEEIGLNATLEFTGAGAIQRAALTGDVTAAAGGNATTIANDTVTYAKMQNVSVASKLLGRGSAGGAGDVEEITLGTNLSMSGTTLNATGGGGLSDGDYGDITVGGGGTTLTIDNSAVTLAKMANLTGYRIIGRDDAVAGTPTALSVSGGLEFLGTGTGIQRSALTGDVTASAGSNATTIANDAVTFGKMQNIATDKLLGRDSAASGDVEEIGLNATLEFTGAGAIQRAALTGDVTAAAGGNATTIANDVVTYAKMQNVSAADRLLGRGNGSGSGDAQELTLGSGLALTTTVLGLTSALARMSSLTPIAVTGASSATLNSWHVVSGTSADYEIELSGLSPTTGDIVGFYVKDWTAANKQYKLDASGTVKIAGRTRYLILLHTNCVILQWDGTDWQPLVLNLDTPWVNDGEISLTAVTTNPSKGTTSTDDSFWRRVGASIEHRIEYKQTGAGGAGSGDYLFGLPIGAVDTALVPTDTGTGFGTNCAAIFGFFRCRNSSSGTDPVVHSPVLYDSTHYRLTVASHGTDKVASSLRHTNNANTAYHGVASFPMLDW